MKKEIKNKSSENISLLSSVSNPYTCNITQNLAVSATIIQDYLIQGNVVIFGAKKVVTSDTPNGSYDTVYIGFTGFNDGSRLVSSTLNGLTLVSFCAINDGIMGGGSSGYRLQIKFNKNSYYDNRTLYLSSSNGLSCIMKYSEASNATYYYNNTDNNMINYIINNIGKELSFTISIK